LNLVKVGGLRGYKIIYTVQEPILSSRFAFWRFASVSGVPHVFWYLFDLPKFKRHLKRKLTSSIIIWVDRCGYRTAIVSLTGCVGTGFEFYRGKFFPCKAAKERLAMAPCHRQSLDVELR
jgi:hypothetical protein